MHIHLKYNYLSLQWITVVVRGVYDEAGVAADIFNYKYSYCKQNQGPETNDIQCSFIFLKQLHANNVAGTKDIEVPCQQFTT